MNLLNLLESPNLGAPSNTPGAQDIGDQHSPSPIGSGTSKREAKKKPVTMMGVGVRESKIIEVWEPLTEAQVPNFLDDDFYAYDPETKEIKGTWSHKSVGRRHSEHQAQTMGWQVVSGMRARSLGLHYPDKGVAEAGPFSYGAKKPRKGSVADLAAKKRKEQERGKQPIEPKDQMVGTARVIKDVTEAPGISKKKENKFHVKLDKLVHDTFGHSSAEMKEGSVQDRLHKRHQELRKKSGLPDPNYYKELKATYDLPDEERYAKAAELKKKYNVKEDILDRAAPKLPKPRNPAEKILTAKRISGAAGKHVNKKRQVQLQPKHRGRDDLDESLKSKLAGAALAGALATGAAAGNLPDLIGKVTMDVNGQQVTKEFNLGNDYASPMAAQRDLEKFLRNKGVTNFYIELQRAAPDNKFQPQDTRPGPYGARSVSGPGGVVDTAGQVSRDVEGGNWRGAAEKAYKTYQQNKNADLGAVGRGELKDRIVRGVVGGLGLDEDLNEEMEQYLYQLDVAGYDILAEAEAIKGADGKRCWKGKRYAGTKNGRDICIDVNEEKKGLYYYVNQRKEKGIGRSKNHPKAPSAQDWKDAAKTAKK